MSSTSTKPSCSYRASTIMKQCKHPVKYKVIWQNGLIHFICEGHLNNHKESWLEQGAKIEVIV